MGRYMDEEHRGKVTAWFVLALLALAYYGNYYVYDSIGPVADLLGSQRGFSDSQIGMLNAIYSLPNIVLILLGGILVDRFGAARMLVWTASICLVGAVLTATSPGYAGMVAGRLLFGIGGETFGIAIMAGVVKYFSGRNLAFALGAVLAIARAKRYPPGRVQFARALVDEHGAALDRVPRPFTPEVARALVERLAREQTQWCVLLLPTEQLREAQRRSLLRARTLVADDADDRGCLRIYSNALRNLPAVATITTINGLANVITPIAGPASKANSLRAACKIAGSADEQAIGQFSRYLHTIGMGWRTWLRDCELVASWGASHPTEDNSERG